MKLFLQRADLEKFLEWLDRGNDESEEDDEEL